MLQNEPIFFNLQLVLGPYQFVSSTRNHRHAGTNTASANAGCKEGVCIVHKFAFLLSYNSSPRKHQIALFPFAASCAPLLMKYKVKNFRNLCFSLPVMQKLTSHLSGSDTRHCISIRNVATSQQLFVTIPEIIQYCKIQKWVDQVVQIKPCKITNI